MMAAEVVAVHTVEVAVDPMGQPGRLNSQGAPLHHQAIPLHQLLRHRRQPLRHRRLQPAPYVTHAGRSLCLYSLPIVPTTRPLGVSYQVINNNYVNVTNGTANVSKCVCIHVSHCMRMSQVHFPEVLGLLSALACSSNAVSSQSTPPQQDNASQGSQQQQQGAQQQGPQQQGGGGYYPG